MLTGAKVLLIKLVIGHGLGVGSILSTGLKLVLLFEHGLIPGILPGLIEDPQIAKRAPTVATRGRGRQYYCNISY
jgi:hypothetical protein